MSIHGVLGEATSYPQSYDASVLFAIPRSIGRDEILSKTGVEPAKLSTGVDIWQAFELSWLTVQGVSKVALARIMIDAASPNIVESKSLKLYLNSLNFSRFADVAQVQAVITKDVSDCIGADVTVQIFPIGDGSWEIAKPLGVCIDDVLDALPNDLTQNSLAQDDKRQTFGADEIAICDDIDASALMGAKKGRLTTYQFHTNLLRSNCPVTNQPDWGTLTISITTDKVVNYPSMLRYVLSYRKHNGFHEQCVEQVFADLLVHFSPSALMVYANYTRRGGIDINPVRVFNHTIPSIARHCRQ